MKRWVRVVLRVGVVVGGLYALACVVAALAYRPFLFPAPSRPSTISGRDDSRETLEAKTSDGQTAWALCFGPKDAALTVVFFHGNGELATDNVGLARELASHGHAVALAEYRGYGNARAAGPPTEAGLYADAEAIIKALAVPRDRLVLMGFSLGTGVATEMAARGYGHALVLLAPYTSIPDVAAHHVPVLPMRLLMRDKFDSKSKAASITMPVLVAHGDVDEVVPFDMGETLAHTFPHGVFAPVPGGHHTDMFAVDAHLMQRVVDFLIEVTPL